MYYFGFWFERILEYFDRWVEWYFQRPCDYKPERMRFLIKALIGAIILASIIAVLVCTWLKSVKVPEVSIGAIGGIIFILGIGLMRISRRNDKKTREMWSKWWHGELPIYFCFLL